MCAISLSRGTQSSFPHIIIRTMRSRQAPRGTNSRRLHGWQREISFKWAAMVALDFLLLGAGGAFISARRGRALSAFPPLWRRGSTATSKSWVIVAHLAMVLATLSNISRLTARWRAQPSAFVPSPRKTTSMR